MKESWLAVDIRTKLNAQARERQQESNKAKENKKQDCFRKVRGKIMDKKVLKDRWTKRKQRKEMKKKEMWT